MLYELLTGHLPFDPDELQQAGWRELRRIIREHDPPRPSAARDHGPEPEDPRRQPAHRRAATCGGRSAATSTGS